MAERRSTRVGSSTTAGGVLPYEFESGCPARLGLRRGKELCGLGGPRERAVRKAVLFGLKCAASWAAMLAIASAGCAAAGDADFYSYPVGARDYKVKQVIKGPITRLEVRWPSWVRTGYAENDQARAIVFFARGGERRPAVIVLHSWRSRKARSEIALCRALAQRGFVSMLVVLPFHMGRAPAGSDSGDMMITGDLERTARAFRQAVVDARTALDFLSRMDIVDADRFGIAGISLGAVVAAITVGVEPRLKAAVLILGGGEIKTMLRESPLLFSVKRRLGDGLPSARTQELLRLMDPLTFAEQARGRCILMVNGRHDLFMPAASASALWQALGNPSIFWLSTGHYGPALVSQSIFDLTGKFLARCFGLEQGPLPAVNAPGIKFSLLALSDGLFRPWVGVELTPLGDSAWLDLAVSDTGLSLQALRKIRSGLVGGVCVYREASHLRAAAAAGFQFAF